MTAALRGVPAAPGVALAEPWVYRPATGGDDRVGLDEAVATAAAQLTALGERLRAAGREDEAGILDAQALMAEDPELLSAAGRAMEGGSGASAAILAAGEEQAALLEGLEDEVLSARAADVRDVAERIARVVRGQAIPALERRSVAVAVDLPPSVTAELDPRFLVGIALEAGSPTAHAAILARALGIPAVVGVPGLLDAVEQAATIGVDGGSGEILLDPDSAATERLETAMAARRDLEAADAALRDAELATSDGHRVMLGANIGRPEEAKDAAEAGAEGIGLFRTEFMFMGRTTAPSVEAQAAAYARALAPFAGRPVVIRTLDVGGDKQLPYLRQPPEDNPFLGVRAIRLATGNRPLLVGQLRAILTAAAGSDAEAWIMAPMVADMADVELVRGLVEEAGGSGDATVKVGIMVELPAAAVVADQLAEAVDFFSIGTNDLTQYLLAVDRTNPALAERQDPMHPAVLRSIRSVIEAGHERGIPVAVCGEMAGDPAGAVVLTGLGIDELSMDPRSFGGVKRALASLSLADTRRVAERALAAHSASEAREIATSAMAGTVGSTHG
ncbi:MAG TPA: phosphoenolpyruvate--protein phosphotransferase [Candidatus Limnocylindria bacterium]|nr:phosphoenolpyruvate--protein phosphotransferase [Candidatus Limnocylindria bacterium]